MSVKFTDIQIRILVKIVKNGRMFFHTVRFPEFGAISKLFFKSAKKFLSSYYRFDGSGELILRDKGRYLVGRC
jgi:hypothetical protein